MFDHKVRYAAANWHSLGKSNASKRGPLHRVHVDQSRAGALMELERRLPGEAAELQKRRLQIINVRSPDQGHFRQFSWLNLVVKI